MTRFVTNIYIYLSLYLSLSIYIFLSLSYSSPQAKLQVFGNSKLFFIHLLFYYSSCLFRAMPGTGTTFLRLLVAATSLPSCLRQAPLVGSTACPLQKSASSRILKRRKQRSRRRCEANVECDSSCVRDGRCSSRWCAAFAQLCEEQKSNDRSASQPIIFTAQQLYL